MIFVMVFERAKIDRNRINEKINPNEEKLNIIDIDASISKPLYS